MIVLSNIARLLLNSFYVCQYLAYIFNFLGVKHTKTPLSGLSHFQAFSDYRTVISSNSTDSFGQSKSKEGIITK